jgi:transcriptional regulator GlxA family with amidase domain
MSDGPVLHVWPDHAVYLAADLDADTHAHHAAQISLALQGSLEVRVGDPGEWSRLMGVIIAADQPHAVRASNPLAQLYLEPESQLGRRLVTVLDGASHRPLPESAVRSILPPLRRCWRQQLPFRAVQASFELASAALLDARPAASLDPRVCAVLARLREHYRRPPPLAELASGVGLSAGRLSHLFREEVGLPIRRYTLWLRVMGAAAALSRGTDHIEAALDNGFADASHMSRTFRRMLSLPPGRFPKVFLADSQFVQDGSDDSA